MGLTSVKYEMDYLCNPVNAADVSSALIVEDRKGIEREAIPLRSLVSLILTNDCRQKL